MRALNFGDTFKIARIGKKVGVGVWWTVCLLLVVGSFIYPLAATLSMTQEFSLKPTLDAIYFDKQSHPGDYDAIMWLNSEVGGAPVIIEATGSGGSYSLSYFRVSSRTGLPTIIGLVSYERLWRQDMDEVFASRTEDVDLIYTSNDSTPVQALLDKYGVTFVYVGYLERAKYGESVGTKFSGFMDIAYENSEVVIYRVREGQ